MAERRRGVQSVGREATRRRVGRLRRLLGERGLDALLITSPNDILYLTGFVGEASVALVGPKKLWILSDFRFQEELEPLKAFATVIIRTGPMGAAMAALVNDTGFKRVGVQSDVMTAAAKSTLAKGVGARRLVDAPGLLSGLRAVKDEQELATIRAAIRVQERALALTLPTIKPGQPEVEIAAQLEFECRRLGAEGMSFGTIVAANANGSRPHYRAGAAKTKQGGTLLIDWGARVGGYCSDMTRTFALGRWSPRMREVYRIVLEAHEAGVSAVRAGMRCRDVDAAARSVIERAGYGAEFGHSLGHGIGLDIHEEPRVAKEVDRELESGMVITIEPGIYLPGLGGVRIEDDIVVGPRGGRSLCSLPKDLSWATLHG